MQRHSRTQLSFSVLVRLYPLFKQRYLPCVYKRRPRLGEVGEAEGEVAHGNDGVGADARLRRALQHGEEQLQVTVTE